MPPWIWFVVGIVVAAALLYFNTAWVGLFDRSRRNQRDAVTRDYELPRYWLPATDEIYADGREGWRGWDGWYFFVIPDDRTVPVQMIRGSLMTGLYGLEGIDNLDRLLLRLDTTEAVEHVLLTPARQQVGTEERLENNLFQTYLPKATDLRMKIHELDTAVVATNPAKDETRLQYGRIRGQWPNYRMEFENPECGIRVELEYQGAKRLVWWADLPGIFTYFAAFGRFSGNITFQHGTKKANAYELTGPPETFAITGRGAFEHGFARKPFDFDPLFLPFRFIRAWFPLRVISYHYDLLVDDSGLEGGIMRATGFGIVFRNQGGIYNGTSFARVTDVKVTYEPASAEHILTATGKDEVDFHQKWHVVAQTSGGVLDYHATREFPAAPLAEGMIYYHFSYKGTFNGQAIAGRGYGEQVSV